MGKVSRYPWKFACLLLACPSKLQIYQANYQMQATASDNNSSSSKKKKKKKK
jgi:hypothetical protein